LIGKSAILRDFGLIQHFESVALEQFETAPAIEGHHLRVDLFDAVVVEMTEVSFQKLTADLDGLGRRKQIDVEMPNGPGRCRNFTPSPRNQPVDVSARLRPIAEITAHHFPAVGEILPEALILVPERIA